MTIDDNIKDGELNYSTDVEAAKNLYHQEKLTKTKILQVKKYYLLNKVE